MGEDTSPCRFAPHQAVLETELGVEMCLLHRGTDEVLVLNTTAADLWRLLDGETDVAEAAHVLARTYQVPPEEVLAHAHPLVRDWCERGFLVACDAR